jgi:3-deoxy-D-manno-octulosonic-acid transferase
MYLIYQIVFALFLLIASPYLLVRAIFGAHGLKERLGFWKFTADERKTVWFHAASMGELKVINNVLPELIKIRPELRIVISTITKTGKTKADKSFSPIEVFYMPLDLRCCISRTFHKIKPSLLILIETEIWPMLITQAKAANCPVAIINGRISQKSLKFYSLFRPLFKSVLGHVNYVMAQTGDDLERFTSLGLDTDHIADYGNIKFDQVLNRDTRPIAPEMKAYLDDDETKFVFIAGSIWPREFSPVINAIMATSEDHPELINILAPRHMKHLKQLEEALHLAHLPYIRRSKMADTNTDAKVMILDTMGELSNLYSYAHLAFVGGSLVNVGGHDPLEPASAGCPVGFGPNMQNARLFADILVDSGGGFYLSGEDALTGLLQKLVVDKALAKNLGRKAHLAVLSHAGVSRRIAEKLAEYL